MMFGTYQKSLTIPVPPEAIFLYLRSAANLDLMKRYAPDYWEFTGKYDIIEEDAPFTLVMRAAKWGSKMTQEYRLRSAGPDHTEVTITIKVVLVFDFGAKQAMLGEIQALLAFAAGWLLGNEIAK